MQCPACERALVQKTVGDLTVDVCEGGCGGIWFDNFELQKVDEQHETAGEALLDIPLDPSIVVDFESRRKCVKCEDQTMMRHFASVHRRVEVDECPQCGSVWLDAGELRQFREQYFSNDEREAAAAAYFADLFDSEIEESIEKDGTLSRIFRYICPSYYIKGKQYWGAF
jgi:uncharacterized protein